MIHYSRKEEEPQREQKKKRKKKWKEVGCMEGERGEASQPEFFIVCNPFWWDLASFPFCNF